MLMFILTQCHVHSPAGGGVPVSFFGSDPSQSHSMLGVCQSSLMLLTVDETYLTP